MMTLIKFILIKKECLLLALVVAMLFMQFQNLFAENKMREEGNAFWEWFAWKYDNVSNPEQKKIIAYFKRINKLVEKAIATQYGVEESIWGDPSPKRAYGIVSLSIKTIEKITPPLLCNKYHNLSLRILRFVADCQKRRIDLGDAKISAKRKEEQLFEEKLRGEQLEQSKLQAERSVEFYDILRKIGFYSNAINEMLDLKLINPEEKIELERLGIVEGADLKTPK